MLPQRQSPPLVLHPLRSPDGDLRLPHGGLLQAGQGVAHPDRPAPGAHPVGSGEPGVRGALLRGFFRGHLRRGQVARYAVQVASQVHTHQPAVVH